MRQRKQKRLTAWLLTLIMAVSLFPGLGLNAQAVEEESLDPPAVTETTVTPEQTETGTPESPAETEPPEDSILTEEQTVSQPAVPAATGDACIKVIMDNGQSLTLYPGWVIRKGTSDYYAEEVTHLPGIYVAYLTKTNMYQWTLELNCLNGQSITYVPGNNYANSVVLSLNGENVLAPKDGGAVDANQHNYRAISCGKEIGDGRPKGLSFIIEGGGSLAIHANDRNTAYQMLTAQCIFAQGLTIRGDAKVSIDLKLPDYQDSDSDSHTIFTSNLYVFDNASLDIKSYNLSEVVKANAHDVGGRSFISIDTTGTVNVEFGCDDLEHGNPRVFCGYPDSTICVYSIDKVGYMSIARNGSRSDNYKEPDRFDFVAWPHITVSGDLTVKKFTSDNIKRIQYFSVADSSAVKVQLFDGRIQDGKFKAYDELWVPLLNVTADLTITAPECAAPFDRWSTITPDLTAEDPGFNLPVNGVAVSNKTITLYFDGDSPDTYRILAKYDPFGGFPKWAKGYSPAANCPTGTVSWTAPNSMKDVKGMLIPAAFQLSGSSPVAAKDTSGNDIDKVKSGVSVFAKQSGSGITYVLSDTGAKRVALNFNGRWHFSEPFVPDLDDLELPPAPELASLNCSGEETPLSPDTAECYPFARGLIVKATNFDYDQYEMYYTFNNGGSDPGDPAGTSPSTSSGVIVLKSSETWTGVTNLRVRFKSKATGAWSPTTWVPLQRISESEPELYEVTFAPTENYTLKGSTVTITGPITATVTKKNPDQWPINAELGCSAHPQIAMARFFEPYTGPVPIDDAGAFRVGVRVPDPKSSSDEYSVIRDENFTIKLAPTYTKYTLTVVNGRAYQANGSEFSTSSTGSSRTYNINGNVLVEVRADPPTGKKVFANWDSRNVGVADRYSPTTTLTMPTHNNATVTANLNGDPLITGETRLRMTPEDGPIGALSFFHKNFGSRRQLTYDWYEGSQKLEPDADFEPGKCYTAQVEVTPVEGAYFDSLDKLSMGLNHASGTQDIPFTRESDQLLRTEIRLLTKPVLTMALAPGDSLPTAAELNDQLPAGYTVTALTWADNAAAVPDGATEMTLTELKISGTESRSQITGGAVVIDGTAYPVSNSYFNTLTLTDVTLPVKPKGVSVSGTVTSYGSDSDDVTVQLIEAGHTEPAYEAIVRGSSAAYSFPIVPAGTYTLKVMKKGHAPFAKEITVGGSNVTEDVTIYLIGDVNGDGKIDATDMQRIYAHISGENPISISRGDVNGDGKVDATDMQRIYAHISGENPLS